MFIVGIFFGTPLLYSLTNDVDYYTIWKRDIWMYTIISISLGFLFGFTAGVVGRYVKITIPFRDSLEAKRVLNKELRKMSYYPKSRKKNVIMYKPKPLFKTFLSNFELVPVSIYLRMEKNKMILIGPAGCIWGFKTAYKSSLRKVQVRKDSKITTRNN